MPLAPAAPLLVPIVEGTQPLLGARVGVTPSEVATMNPAGKGLLLDTTKLGYVAVRESLSMRIGYWGTDFAQNIPSPRNASSCA